MYNLSTTTTTTMLNLSSNRIEGVAGGSRLRRLVETMPNLEKAKYFEEPSWFGWSKSALFQGEP